MRSRGAVAQILSEKIAIYIIFSTSACRKGAFSGRPGRRSARPANGLACKPLALIRVSERGSEVWSGGTGGWMLASAPTRLNVVGSTLDFMGFFFFFFFLSFLRSVFGRTGKGCVTNKNCSS
jgi:hypothetical protein